MSPYLNGKLKFETEHKFHFQVVADFNARNLCYTLQVKTDCVVNLPFFFTLYD